MTYNKLMYLFCFGVIFLITSCKVETSNEVFNEIIKKESFKVCAIHYGGITGKGRTSYTFVQRKDSIDLKIIYHGIIPNEDYDVKLSKEEFEQVRNSLRCMLKEHRNEAVRPNGCQPPFSVEYFLHDRLKTMRVYPKEKSKCDFTEVIYPKYEEESLLNLISDES